MLVLVDMLKGIVLVFRNSPAAPVASDSMISRAALAAFNMINDRWTSCADGTALLSFLSEVAELPPLLSSGILCKGVGRRIWHKSITLTDRWLPRALDYHGSVAIHGSRMRDAPLKRIVRF